MGHIYMLKSPSGKSYIGQTTRSVEERFKAHLKKSSQCRGISGAIKKYGWENFELDWYECPDNELNKHEKWMVKLLGTISPEGYNLKEGGGNRGKMSEESKQKCREANLGKKASEETKERMRKPRGEEFKQSMSGEKNPMYGKTGEKNPMYGTTGEKSPRSKRVYRYDLDGTFIDSFGSCREAGRYLNKKHSIIGRCARGSRKYKTAYNYKWSYNMEIFV
jgi:group I intron endonuclease